MSPAEADAATGEKLSRLAFLTGAMLLATDLILPAIPLLNLDYGATIASSQGVLSAFFAGFALAQIFWAEMLRLFSPGMCLKAGVLSFTVISATLSIELSFDWMLALRFLQGLAAGAATVVVPVLVKIALPGRSAVDVLARIGMLEALVPALAPIIGALLLLALPWRLLHGAVALAALVAFIAALRVIPPATPALKGSGASYLSLMQNRTYWRNGACYALTLGILLSFVATMPQHIATIKPGADWAFPLLQLLGVAGFALGASRASALSGKLGEAAVLRISSVAHLAIVLAAWAIYAFDAAGYPTLCMFWIAFCLVTGLKCPIAFNQALSLPENLLARASGLLILSTMVCAAVGTQTIAHFSPVSGFEHGWPVMLVATLAAGVVVRGSIAGPPRNVPGREGAASPATRMPQDPHDRAQSRAAAGMISKP